MQQQHEHHPLERRSVPDTGARYEARHPLTEKKIAEAPSMGNTQSRAGKPLMDQSNRLDDGLHCYKSIGLWFRVSGVSSGISASPEGKVGMGIEIASAATREPRLRGRGRERHNSRSARHVMGRYSRVVRNNPAFCNTGLDRRRVHRRTDGNVHHLQPKEQPPAGDTLGLAMSRTR